MNEQSSERALMNAAAHFILQMACGVQCSELQHDINNRNIVALNFESLSLSLFLFRSFIHYFFRTARSAINSHLHS